MNKLITKSLEIGDVSFINLLPKTFLNKLEEKWIGWINNYLFTFGQPPTIDRLETEFSDFMRITSPDPLPDIFEMEVGYRRNSLLREELAKNEKIIQDGIDPYKFLNDLMNRLNVPSTGIVLGGEFDRTLYERKQKTFDFGLPFIDEVTGGVSVGDLVYIYGRPTSGKTTLLISLIARWTLEGHRVLVISNEIKYEDILYKIDAAIGGLDTNGKRFRTFSDSDRLKLKAIKHLMKSMDSLTVAKNPVSNPSQVLSLAKEVNAEIVCIDGAYLMSLGNKTDNWKEIAEISRQLKQMCNQHRLAIVGVLQGNRQSELSSSLSGIAGSDAYGQDGDTVLFCTADGVAPEGRTINIQTTKNRNGHQAIASMTISFPILDVWENTKS